MEKRVKLFNIKSRFILVHQNVSIFAKVNDLCMSIDNLDIVKELIAGAESDTVEFKETTGQLERGVETLCAFLNGTGGIVLFGVTDKGKIIGQKVSDRTKRDIAEAIRRIEPFANMEISCIDSPDTDNSIIALSAEEQRYMRPFSYKGRAYQRIESVTSSMPQEIYNQLGLYREEELEIPYKALRECCTNAFCHRLYHRPGSSVGIAIYDDRIEIENSGTFPPDMTMEKLLSGHNSEPQNLIIANVLYKSEVLESWGRGISLMISECRRVGISDPEFHTDGNSVWVVFHRRAVGQHPTATRQLPINSTTATPQVERVLVAIGENTVATKEIMSIMGLKDKSNFLELYLYPAIRQNLVEPLYPENPKHPRQKYRLTDKGKEFLMQQ